MTSFLNDWVSVVRRARLGRTVKAVAFALALYANPDGRKVYPGIARLSVECELGTKVIKQSLKALRDSGLIEIVRAATRAGDSSEYRLILAEDLLERIEVPSPALHAMAIRDASDSIRGKYTAVNLRGPGNPADSGLREESAGARDPDPPEPAGAFTSNLRGPANPATTHGPFRLNATSQTEDHLRTAVTVTRENVIRFPVERVARPNCHPNWEAS